MCSSRCARFLRARTARPGEPIATGAAIPLHRVRKPARASLAARAASLAGHFLLAAALIIGGSVALALTLTLVFVAAPLAAAFVLWFVWRAGDGTARQTNRLRARVRRRARALGLTVLAGARSRLVVRLATAGTRSPARPPRCGVR
jgi:membrane protein implicated in regulation of membrane protease activity